jgi:poly(3-hydroxybutyrate) depolymerase
MAVLDMPAEFYLEIFERVYRNNQVGNQIMTYQGKQVDFSAITKTALLKVEDVNDDI